LAFSLHFLQEAMDNGDVHISTRDGRWKTSYGDVHLYVAFVVWQLFHPDEVFAKGDCIHHKDWDRCNDHPNNLVKMTLQQHKMLHVERDYALIPVGIVNQIKRRWLTGMLPEVIRKDLCKTVGSGTIERVIKRNQCRWLQEMSRLIQRLSKAA
jgi:hypothetical protein